ncbi:MAG: hypothetical protein O2960_22640 [Verrucomicrobia bacterium]|nr:hypothetical protein [Verrucomicrobiota bacterium]
MTAQLPADEEALALQTIEMFEVITQSNPSDYESLEILKEAYYKLSRQPDAIKTAKRIAQAYARSGKLSSAILEYESILQSSPHDPDVEKALASLENRTTQLTHPEDPAETAVPEAVLEQLPTGTEFKSGAPLTELEDGRAPMRKLLVEGKQMSQSDFDLYWTSPNLKETPKEPAEPFIQTLADKQILSIDTSLKLITEKSRLCYLPLEKYDVDVDLARGFPREICLRWTILPFDRMSKSVLVATANPFNERAVWELENFNRQTSVANRFIWYVAAPVELLKAIRKTFR